MRHKGGIHIFDGLLLKYFQFFYFIFSYDVKIENEY